MLCAWRLDAAVGTAAGGSELEVHTYQFREHRCAPIVECSCAIERPDQPAVSGRIKPAAKPLFVYSLLTTNNYLAQRCPPPAA